MFLNLVLKECSAFDLFLQKNVQKLEIHLLELINLRFYYVKSR